MAFYVPSAPAPAVGTSSDTVTALAGGGQPGATQLVSRFNRVATVATGADSVLLPFYLRDMSIFVSNDAANALAVFPSPTEQIGSNAANISVSIAAGKTAEFRGSGTTGKWAILQGA